MELEGYIPVKPEIELRKKLYDFSISEDIDSKEVEIFLHRWNKFYKHNPKLISLIVAEIYGITFNQLISRTRKRAIMEPRQLCMFYFRSKSCNLYLIGEYLGGKDHATVLHSARVAKKHIEANDKLFMQKYELFLLAIEKYKDYL